MPLLPDIVPPSPSGRASLPMLGTLLGIAYALWCVGVLWLQPRSLLAILSFLAPCMVFVCSWAWRQQRLFGVALALGLPGALYAAYHRYADQAELFYVAEYFTVYLTLCVWFAASLRRQPLITRVARRVHALTPEMEAYTVKLTRAWSVYFLIMALTSVAAYSWMGLKAWALFTLAVSPVSLLCFFIIEHVLRYYWHPEFERATIAQAIRSWREGVS